MEYLIHEDAAVQYLKKPMDVRDRVPIWYRIAVEGIVVTTCGGEKTMRLRKGGSQVQVTGSGHSQVLRRQ